MPSSLRPHALTRDVSPSDEVTVAIAPRAIAKVTVAVVVLVAMVAALDATRAVVADIAIAAVIACLLRPAVVSLSRRMRLGVAIFLVYLTFFVGVVVVLSLDATALNAGAKALRHAAPDRLATLQNGLPPQNALRRFLVEGDIVARVRTYVDSLPSRFLFGTSSPARGASQIAVILLIISLSGFLVSRGPGIFRRSVAWLPSSWQRTAAAAGRASYRKGGAYMRRTLALTVPCALAAGTLAAACSVPGAALLGLWAGMWAVIPSFGIAVGGLPIVALAFGQGRIQGAAALIGLAAIVIAGEAARRRWVERPTLRVGPFFSLVSVMIGMEVGRWWGAAVFLTGAACLAASLDDRRVTDSARDAHADAHAAADPTSAPNPTEPAEPASAAVAPRRVSVDFDTNSVVLAVAAAFSVVVIVAFGRQIPQSLTRLAIAVFFALALNRVVGTVQQRLGGHRGLAVSAVSVLFLVALVAFTLFAVPQAMRQGRNVDAQARSLVEQLDRAPLIGAQVRSSNLDDRVQSALHDLPHILATHHQALSDAVRSAGEAVVAVGWMLLIGIAALLDGPEIARRFPLLVPPSRRDRVRSVASLTYTTIGRSAAAKGFSALLQGSVVMVIALAFGVPLAPLLGAIATIASFIPQIGGAMAGIPLVLFALSQGLWTAVICGALYVTYMTLNNHLISPLIVGRTLRISPLTSLIAVLIGASLAGFIGAFLATPVVAVVQTLATSSEGDPSPEDAA